MSDFQRAAEARSLARSANDRPSQRPAVRGIIDPSQILRGSTKNDPVVVVGYASTTEQPYEMHDMFGPYTEVVTRGAFKETLSRSPLVEFTVNHGAGGGIPMAHTRNGTLTIVEDETGLRYEAVVDPTRADVADMLKALDRGDLAESSFKFRIDKGIWSPDYTEFRIDQADLERGDVSAVNFGANPNTSSGIAREDVEPKRTRTRLSPMPGELDFR
jgi:HK97 family phage prohead protease